MSLVSTTTYQHLVFVRLITMWELTSKNWDTNKTYTMLNLSDHGRKDREITELDILHNAENEVTFKIHLIQYRKTF